jgi:hypothetical protein
MVCQEFQDLLVEYAELSSDARERADAHLNGCPGCRSFLQALHAVDTTLSAQFTAREAPPSFAAAVRRRVSQESAVRRPSFIPELLDFVGWGAIVALVALLGWWGAPLLPVSKVTDAVAFNATLAAAGAFILAAFFIGLRSIADLKH